MQLSLRFQNIDVMLQLPREYSEVLIIFNKKHIVLHLIINNNILVHTHLSMLFKYLRCFCYDLQLGMNVIKIRTQCKMVYSQM